MSQLSDDINFLGCPVSRLSVTQTLDWIREAIAKGSPCQIAVVNANKFYLMSRHAALRDIIQKADKTKFDRLNFQGFGGAKHKM